MVPVEGGVVLVRRSTPRTAKVSTTAEGLRDGLVVAGAVIVVIRFYDEVIDGSHSHPEAIIKLQETDLPIR